MFFAKDEMIELNNQRKYLILDTALIDEQAYYKIKEISPDLEKLIGDYKIISAINNEGSIYINENIEPEIIEKLNEIFEK